MDSEPRSKKPHAVCIPFPAQGHINPMLKLAKLLHFNGFHITFVHTEFNCKMISAAAASSPFKELDDFRFETIPDGLLPSDPSIKRDIAALCIAIRTKFATPFRDLMYRLNESAAVPSVSCVISDNFMSFAVDVAEEVGVPDVVFCTFSASSFVGLIHTKEVISRGLLPLRSESDLHNGHLDTPIDWIPGYQDMRLKDHPCFYPTTDPNDVILNFVKDESEEALRATAIILNTFDHLEGSILEAMPADVPPIYGIGPLHLLCHQIRHGPSDSIRSSLWKEESDCMEWLEGRKHGSVVYVSFGSLAVVTSHQLTEIAWGIANSGRDFLLVIRRDMGDVGVDVLTREVLVEARGRGFLTSWCPQEEVLTHPSVGGFLTHCGWNSTMESISSGVPMICWPQFSDQPMNCRFACTKWGIGIEIGNEVKRDVVTRAIQVLMEGDAAEVMRDRASEWKKAAVEAAKSSGQSFQNFQRLIKEILLYEEEIQDLVTENL